MPPNSGACFYDYRDMLEKVALDGIVIATPHYDHTPISIDAFQQGIHVLVENRWQCTSKTVAR